jgi:hypothetical protein
MVDELAPSVTYDQIISVAKEEAARLRPSFPALPTNKELELFIGRMWAIDRPLIDTIRRHLDEWGVRSPERNYEGHLEWVAVRAAYVAALECDERGIFDSKLREEIIQRAWRLGLLHDIQAWRGWTPEHQIEGMKAAQQKLEELSIQDEYLEDQILLHEKLNVEPRNNPAFDIPFFSVFAVDHLNWGLEWEKVKWRSFAKKQVSPSQAIHDYQYMLRLKNSPNLQQTKWGRKVATPWVDFGIQIAQHVEQTFSTRQGE